MGLKKEVHRTRREARKVKHIEAGGNPLSKGNLKYINSYFLIIMREAKIKLYTYEELSEEAQHGERFFFSPILEKASQ